MATKEFSLREMPDKRLDTLFDDAQAKISKLQILMSEIDAERRHRSKKAEIEAKKAEIAALEKGL